MLMGPTTLATGHDFLQIVSAMITPAILILASGSLISATLIRLARITDRARQHIDRIEELCASGNIASAEGRRRWLDDLRRRAAFAERALSSFYAAVGLFLAGSLAIAIDNLTRDRLPWLSLALVVGGAASLFAGTASLLLETTVANGSLRREIEESESALRCRESEMSGQAVDKSDGTQRAFGVR